MKFPRPELPKHHTNLPTRPFKEGLNLGDEAIRLKSVAQHFLQGISSDRATEEKLWKGYDLKGLWILRSKLSSVTRCGLQSNGEGAEFVHVIITGSAFISATMRASRTS